MTVYLDSDSKLDRLIGVEGNEVYLKSIGGERLADNFDASSSSSVATFSSSSSVGTKSSSSLSSSVATLSSSSST